MYVFHIITEWWLCRMIGLTKSWYSQLAVSVKGMFFIQEETVRITTHKPLLSAKMTRLLSFFRLPSKKINNVLLGISLQR